MSLTVLVIEDSFDNLMIATMILESKGYTVLQAENGIDGYKMTLEHQPDVIILDYHLPGINGLEVTHMIKAADTIRDIPIVALTADIYAKKDLLDAGCEIYLIKPIRKGSLLRAIKQVLTVQTA